MDGQVQPLEEALAIDASQAIVYYNLACYWSLAGNSKLALQYLSQSFDIDPGYRQLVADEKDFDPIRNLPDFQALIGVAV